MREVRKAFAIAPELPGELFTLELRINDSARILAFTSDNADRLTGFHHPRLLICITEGQGVEDEAYEASLSCVTSPENRLFVYGNPTSPTGPFYRSAHSDNWETLTVNAKQHPNVITGRTEIPGSVSVEWIEMMRDEYGENSSIYQSRVLAKFPDTSIEGLIRRDWLKAAYAKHESGELEDSTKYIPRLLALDIARYGPDKSALAYVQGPIVRELSTWHGLSVTDSANRVMDYGATLQRYSVKPTVYVDEPGLGGGAIDYFKSKGYPAEAFNGAAKPFDDRFLNARAETHWALRTLLENGLVALPRDQALEEELLAIEWTTNIASNKIQILAKDTIPASLGRSPDRADAVVIGLAYSTNAIRKPAVSFRRVRSVLDGQTLQHALNCAPRAQLRRLYAHSSVLPRNASEYLANKYAIKSQESLCSKSVGALVVRSCGSRFLPLARVGRPESPALPLCV